jgi:hypothetical protein
MGRSVAELRVQVFTAATLAQICGGQYADPQRDQVFAASRAIAIAREEADGFEEHPIHPEDWAIEPFPGWEPLLGNDGGA